MDQDNPYAELDSRASEDQGSPYAELDARATEAPPTSKSPPPQVADTWTNAAKGVGEAGLALGAGALKAINLAVNDLVPGSGKAQIKAEIESDPVLNYKAGPEAEPILSALHTLTKPISDATAWAKEKLTNTIGQRPTEIVGDVATLLPTPLGQEAVGAVKGTIGKAAGAYTKYRDAGIAAEEDAAVAGNPLAQTSLEESRRIAQVKANGEAAGLDLSPGKGDINQPKVNAIVRKDLNLPADAPMTHNASGDVPVLDAARKANAGPAYDAARAIPRIELSESQRAALDAVSPNFIPEDLRFSGGVGTGKQAVDLSKLLRKSGNRLINSDQVLSDGTEVSELGRARIKAANALEDSIHDHYLSTDQPELADAFHDARVYTAKSYSAQAALDGAGNIIVNKLKNQTLRNKPLSGGTADLAQLAARFPDAFKKAPAKATPSLLRRAAATAAPIAGAGVGAILGNGLGASAGTAAGKYAGEKILSGQ